MHYIGSLLWPVSLVQYDQPCCEQLLFDIAICLTKWLMLGYPASLYTTKIYLFMQHYMLWGSLYRIQGSTSLCSITCYGAHYIEFKVLPLYAALHVKGLTI